MTKPSVLLIHPCNPDIFPPPAIGYLRAAISDIADVRSAYLGADLGLGNPQFIGISLHSFAVPQMQTMLPRLRAQYPGAHIVAGGHHATALPQETLDLGFDQVITGQGETALRNVILDGVRDKIYSAPCLTKITVPDYTGLDTGTWAMPMGQPGRGIGILSSVGCPFKCSFCASTNFWKGQWRPMTPLETRASLEDQIVRYNLNGWMFEDDNFTLVPERAMQICELIKESPVTKNGGLPWHAASRAESLCSEPLCKAMRTAGCTHVWLGIESLCQSTLDRCRKGTTVEAMINGIGTAKRSGLTPVCQFIVGLPGETEASMSRTIDAARTMNIRAAVNKAWVLPGTDIHTQAIKHGFTNSQYLQGVPFYEYEWPAGTLDRWSNTLGRST